jgi:predicted phosphodiesterase
MLVEYDLKQEIDHLVITGDITHNSDFEDFNQMRKLLKKNKLLDAKKVSLVIGNHDIFGGVHLAEDILTFPDQCERTDYHKKIQEFRYFFDETFTNCYFPYPDKLFPYGKSLEDILFIGLNSIAPYSKIKNIFASKGKLDKLQLEGMKKIVQWSEAENKTKIVLVHHHFGSSRKKAKQNFLENIENFHMKLKKKKKAFQLFKSQGVDLILHGHVHLSNEYWKKGLHFVNAGASVLSLNPDEININFISVENKKIEVVTHQLDKNKLGRRHYFTIPKAVSWEA